MKNVINTNIYINNDRISILNMMFSNLGYIELQIYNICKLMGVDKINLVAKDIFNNIFLSDNASINEIISKLFEEMKDVIDIKGNKSTLINVILYCINNVDILDIAKLSNSYNEYHKLLINMYMKKSLDMKDELTLLNDKIIKKEYFVI
jgi:hypothetical protein